MVKSYMIREMELSDRPREKLKNIGGPGTNSPPYG